MAIINFDYNAAIRQAKEIEDVASDMKVLASRKFQNAVDTIRSSWTGSAANKFLAYCDEVKREIEVKAESLNRTAATIRRVAAQLEEAEKRAKAELAAQRSSGGR